MEKTGQTGAHNSHELTKGKKRKTVVVAGGGTPVSDKTNKIKTQNEEGKAIHRHGVKVRHFRSDWVSICQLSLSNACGGREREREGKREREGRSDITADMKI